MAKWNGGIHFPPRKEEQTLGQLLKAKQQAKKAKRRQWK